MSRPAKGGKRLMSFAFESEPTMLDWPAKMKMRAVLVSASCSEAFDVSAQRDATGTSNRTARTVRMCFTFQVGSAGLFFRCLAGDDGNIADLQARRRSDDQGRVEFRQFAKRGWGQVVAVFLPTPVEFFHA